MDPIEELICRTTLPDASVELDARMEKLFASNCRSAPIAKATVLSLYPLNISWRTIMFGSLGLTSCVIFCLTVAWNLFSGPGGTQLGFAQVIESIEKISTVQFLQVGYSGSQSTSLSPMFREAVEARLKALDGERASTTDQRRKLEIDAASKVLSESLASESQSILSLAWCRSTREKMRSEVVIPFDSVIIHDGGKGVLLDNENKPVRHIKQLVFDSDGRQLIAASDFFKLFEVPIESVVQKGAKIVDGKSAIGYEQTTDARGSSITWWVEKRSKLPLRIEIRNCFSQGVVASEMVYRDITYNAQLSPELFKTETTKDLTVTEHLETFQFTR